MWKFGFPRHTWEILSVTLNKKPRARILSMDPENGYQIIRELSTPGRAVPLCRPTCDPLPRAESSFTVTFDHYEEGSSLISLSGYPF